MRRKPTFVHFQSIKDGSGGDMGIQGQGFHIYYPDNPSILAEEGNTQREEGIFHPKPVVILCFEDKEHPFVFPQMFSAHQPIAPFLWSLGNLHQDFFVMDIKRNS